MRNGTDSREGERETLLHDSADVAGHLCTLTPKTAHVTLWILVAEYVVWIFNYHLIQNSFGQLGSCACMLPIFVLNFCACDCALDALLSDVAAPGNGETGAEF